MKTFSKIEGNINLFVRVVKIKDENVPFFTSSVSTKQPDGTYQNANIQVRLSKAAKANITTFDKKKLDNGCFMVKAVVEDGWLIPISQKGVDFPVVGLFINTIIPQSAIDTEEKPW